MLWTAEAVDILKRLALDGRSASAIAAALGAPSRNAVIGKANRIGIRLNGGGRASAPGATPVGACRGSLPALPRPVAGDTGQSRAPARSLEPAGKAGWSFAEAEVGEMRRVRFDEIREFACRWPLGDPRSGDFAYCGLKPAEGRSYCAGHCRMAYQTPKAPARAKAARAAVVPRNREVLAAGLRAASNPLRPRSASQCSTMLTAPGGRVRRSGRPGHTTTRRRWRGNG